MEFSSIRIKVKEATANASGDYCRVYLFPKVRWYLINQAQLELDV